MMRSSYLENDFGSVFENTIFAFPPRLAVELGVLDGYSAAYIGRGLKKVEKLKGSVGHLDAYDLWEDYEFKHGRMEDVQLVLKAAGVDKYVSLHKADAFIAHEKYDNNSIDFLHIDISNDGDIIQQMVSNWTPKLRHCGLFLFEGGSEERDQVEWMIKYDKKPIRPVLDSNPIIRDNYIYGSYVMMPSLTIMKKITLTE